MLISFYKKLIHRIRASRRYKHQNILIHVGKSGGTTVRSVLTQEGRADKFRFVHIHKPWYSPKLNYYIVLRDPIQRALSAFNWRYNIVMEQGKQRERVEGEYKALQTYATFNELAESLYTDGQANTLAHSHFKSILHLRENIAFYLDDFLSICHPDSIIAVLQQENLQQDIKRVFGIDTKLRQNENTQDQTKLHLSDTAIVNLRRILAKDYAIIDHLRALKKM